MDTEVLPQIDPISAERIARIVCWDLNAVAVVVSVLLFTDNLEQARLGRRLSTKCYRVSASVEIAYEKC